MIKFLYVFLIRSIFAEVQSFNPKAPSGCKSFAHGFSSAGVCKKSDQSGGQLEIKHYQGTDCNENRWFYRVVYDVSNQKCTRASMYDLMGFDYEGYFECKLENEIEVNTATCEDRSTLRTVGNMVAPALDEPVENESAYRTGSCIVHDETSVGGVYREILNKCEDKLGVTYTYRSGNCKNDEDIDIKEYVQYEHDKCYRVTGSSMGFTYTCDPENRSFNSSWCNPNEKDAESRVKALDHRADSTCIMNSNGQTSVKGMCDGRNGDTVRYSTYGDKGCQVQLKLHEIKIGGGCKNVLNDEHAEWLPTYFRAWCTDQNYLRVQECYPHQYSETDGNRDMPNFDDLTPDDGESKKGGHGWIWVLLVIFLLVGFSACGYFGYNYYKEHSGESGSFASKFGNFLPYTLHEDDGTDGVDESRED